MASYKFEKAIVVGVGPIQQVSESFKKREMVISIDNDGQYPQKISIEAVQDKCNDQNLNEVRPGDEVSVDVNFRGNEWFDQKNNVTKYFNQLVYWKMSINRTSAGNNTQQNQQNFVPQGQHPIQQQQQAFGNPPQGGQFGQPQQQPQGNPQFGQPQAQPVQQPFGQPTPYQEPFGQPNQFQQGPPAQQFGQPNQFQQPVQTQQTQMQPQPVQQQWVDPSQQQQNGYIPNLQTPERDLPF